jgi:hypothetical protein
MAMTTIVQWITSKRLRWAGHVARMEEGGLIVEITRGNPEARTRVGRPRMRWRDSMRRDVEVLGIENPDAWWDLAWDGEQWLHFVEATTVRSGPQPAE